MTLSTGIISVTLLFFVASAAVSHAEAIITVGYREGIETDGNLSDWNGISFLTVTPQNGVFDAATVPPESDQDLSFRFAVAHDRRALYVAVEVTDDFLYADSCTAGSLSAPVWDDDAVEVFLDGNHNRAPDSRLADGSELKFGGEFGIAANGAAMSDYSGYPKSFGRLWSGAADYNSVTNGTSENMCYEFRFPWRVMGLKEMPSAIGFNISVQDDDSGGRRNHALYWRGNPERPFSDESAFGTLQFCNPIQD